MKRFAVTMAFALVVASVTSAITAVAKLTFALLIPPMARARTKTKKLSAMTQIAYETAIPA